MSSKIQCVKRRSGARQWFVTVPASMVRQMGIHEGELVDWYATGRGDLVMYREGQAEESVEKKRGTHSPA